VNNPNFNQNDPIGRVFILPSSFEGSDQAMKQHYYDGLEIAGQFGKADYFLTFTSNPHWSELKRTLANGQGYLSRPDMCSRLYNLKFKELFKDIMELHKIGVVIAYVFVKEFQKHELAQIQTRAAQADANQDQADAEQENDDYDVQLNRPNNANDEVGFEDELAANVVMDNGQDGANDNNDNGDNNNDNGDGVNLNNVPDDDINRLNNHVVYDEIRTYEKKRYVSSIEACDKFLGHSRLGMSHKIESMVIHLEDRQNVVFNQRNVTGVVNREQRTMLTDFFDLNVRDPNANQFLYKDIITMYKFDTNTKRWSLRTSAASRDRVIGRMAFIHLRRKELYHLKLLLLHVRGPTSYAFLRTVNGLEHSTFEAAAIALQLVENNHQWADMMREVCRVEMPSHIRFVYASLLYHNNLIRPSALYLCLEFRDQMSEDYQNEPLADTKYMKALGHIRSILVTFGCNLVDYNLPEPDERGDDWWHR
ncbi:hypothetical protein BpHYR1_018101, partial [Brachionus plicatilis]